MTEPREGQCLELLQQLDAIVWRTGPASLRVTFVGGLSVARLGWAPEQWLADEDFIAHHLPADEREQALGIMRAVLADGVDRSLVHRFCTPDGRALWFRTKLHAVREGDAPAGLVAFSGDLTERVRALTELSEEERWHRLLLERMPVMFWTTDRDLKFTSGAGAGLARIGLRPDLLVGVSVLEYFQTTDPENPLVAPSLRALEGQAVTVDAAFGGRTFTVHLEPFRDGDGELIGTIGVAVDITERRLAEQAEREREERLLANEKAAREAAQQAEGRASFLAQASRVLSSSLDHESTLADLARLSVPLLADWCVVRVIDGRGGVRTAAAEHVVPALVPRVEDLASLARGGLPSAGAIAEEHSRDPAAVLAALGIDGPEALDRVRDLGFAWSVTRPLIVRQATVGVMTLVSAEESRRCSEATRAIAEDLVPRIAQAVENALLYREAQDAIGIRDEFLSVASHELRTPCTSVMLTLQSLIRAAERAPAKLAPERIRKLLEIADRQNQRLAGLIDRLLDVTRIEAGKLRLELEPTDLRAIAEEVLAGFEGESGRVGSSVSLRAGPGVTGSWDPARLEQVVTNLITNAFLYGAGKPIEIDVDADEETARFRIRDHGIGVAPEQRRAIFERFARATPDQGYAGLGLGLYIAREIVEAHGGRIRVESAPGGGSLFTFELPRSGPARLEAIRTAAA